MRLERKKTEEVQTPKPESEQQLPTKQIDRPQYVPPIVPGADEDMSSSAIRRMEHKKRKENRAEVDTARRSGPWLTSTPKPVAKEGQKRKPPPTVRETPKPTTGSLFQEEAPVERQGTSKISAEDLIASGLNKPAKTPVPENKEPREAPEALVPPTSMRDLTPA